MTDLSSLKNSIDKWTLLQDDIIFKEVDSST